MQNEIFAQAAEFLRERRDKRRWKAVVLCLAILVICATAWLLLRESRALTLSGDALSCPVVVHVHTADCSDADGNLICKKADYVFHMHTADCSDADGRLVCPLEETEPHEHDTDCFKTEKVLICGYEEEGNTPPPDEGQTVPPEGEGGTPAEEGQTIPSEGEGETPAEEGQTTPAEGQVETPAEERQTIPAEGQGETLAEEGQTTPAENRQTTLSDTERETPAENGRTALAVNTGERELICTKEEHTHAADCYGEPEKKLTCSLEEEEHTHDDSCYDDIIEEVLVCDKEEGENHAHDGSCYENQAVGKELICTKGHTHTEECYAADGEPALICGKEPHTHEETCYKSADSDNRQKEESSGDSENRQEESGGDSENRQEETSGDSDSRQEETSGDSDSRQEEETGGDTGHIHTDNCYRIVRRTDCGKKGVHIHDDECYQDGVLICEIPYVESVEEHIHDAECFGTDEDYTKTFSNDRIAVTAVYKKSAQIPEDARLDVEEITRESDAQHYEKRLETLKETDGALGDGEALAVLLRIGFYTDDERFMPEDTVRLTVRFLDDSIYAAGDTAKTACFDEDGIRRLITGMEIDNEGALAFELKEFSELAFLTAAEPKKERTLVYEGESCIVTVSLGENTQIPADAQLMAEQITAEGSPEHFEGRAAQLKETEGMLEEEEGIALLLRLWLTVDGEEIPLGETADVTVQFLDNALYFEGDAVKAAHFTGDGEEGGAELLSASDIDSENSTTFKVSELNEFAFITQDVRVMTYEGEDFIVTVRFHETARIPEDAKLAAERITEESDLGSFVEYESELREHAEEKFLVVDALVDIGFYAGDKEIEPQDTVEVKIQLLDNKEERGTEEDGSRLVAHFAEEGVEILEDAEIYVDEDNSLSTTFQTDSFSTYAVARKTNTVTTAEQFHYFMETAAEDGDTIIIGADINFEKPDFSYSYDTVPKNKRVPDTADLYQGYYLGDTGEVIIAKLLTDGASTDEHKHITLDLNGYTLRLLGDNMTLVDICWGAELTVVDSGGKTEDVYSVPYDITTSTPVDSSSGKTVESTETRTASGGAILGNGYREDFWKDDGAHANKWGNGGNNSAVITMWFGRLNLEGGIIADNANRAIRCRGGEINLNGGYLLNNAAKEYYPREGENKYPYGTSDTRWYGYYGGALGGAVVCEEVPGWIVKDGTWQNITIDETVGVAPRAPGTVNLRGTVLSGNRALQGGAIHATGCHITISGGYVTHNRAYFRYWGGGGGGIKVDGPIATDKGKIVGAGDFTMTGGQITANETAGGGGGVCISRKATVDLKGGFIAGNTTTSGTNGEGGGVALYEEWTKIFIDTKDETITNPGDWPKDENGNTISPPEREKPEGFYVTTPFAPTAHIGDSDGSHKLYITNNHSKSETDWGGGGLFVSEGATAYLYNILISENSTKGFGGGLAGCATGRILDFTGAEKGAAIFGNSASGDAYAGDDSAKHEDRDYTKKETNPVFWERDADGRYLFQDYFSALYSKLGNGMIGGGLENWDGSMDGERLDTAARDENGKWMASYVAGLTAHPTEQDKAKARQYTFTYITGNTSMTHGGGVMCNGIISIGEGQMEITSAMQLKATKAIKDGDTITTTMQPGQFSFTVYAETNTNKPQGVDAKLGAVASTGTNDAEGNITFNKLLTFQKTGWVRFILVEDKVSDQAANIGIATDATAYLISVFVQKVDKTDPSRKFYDIQGINLERGDILYIDGEPCFRFKSDNSRWINIDYWNHGYTGDQLYHSEDHPLILDLTKGVLKYDYPAYHVVVSYANAPAHTFTNTKHETTRIIVEKKWDSGVSDSERKSVTVQLYRKVIGSDAPPEKYGDEITLAQNGFVAWAWQWTGLPVTSPSGGRYAYEVKEIAVNGDADAVDDYIIQYAYEYKPDINGAKADTITITNSPKTYGIELTKCDEKGARLSGAKFVISKAKNINAENIDSDANVLSFLRSNGGYVYYNGTDTGDRISKLLATSEDDREDGKNAGMISISGLPKGTYYLIETAAPRGYLPTEVHKITIGGTNRLEIECSSGAGCAVKTDGADKDVLYIKLTDEAEKYTLPKTGGFGMDYLNIFGAAAISGMAVFICMTCRRRKKEVTG